MRMYLALVLLAAGCYSPRYDDCRVSCAASQVCPAGLECDGKVCRAPGMTEPCVMPDAADDARVVRVTLDTYAEAQLAALCGYYVRCGAYASEASCVSVLERFLVTRIADIVAAVNAGKAVFDPEASQTCIDSFSTRSCDRSFVNTNRGADPACLDGITGLVPELQTCALDEECISGECNRGSCAPDMCCQGFCVGSASPQARNVTEPCSSRDLCINSYCDRTAPNPICTAYKPAAAQCGTNDECQDGHQCKVVNGTTPTCTPRGATSAPCATSNDCLQLSNVCSPNGCTVGGTEGSMCSAFAQQDCQMSHYCGPQSMCLLPPTVGESCTPAMMCRGSYCGGPNGNTCVPYKTDGMTCDPAFSGRDCESQYCGPTGNCAPRPACI